MRRFRFILTACSLASLASLTGNLRAATPEEPSSKAPVTTTPVTATDKTAGSTNDKDQAHPSSVDVKKDLATVIESQLAAFREGDYGKAYTFAASEIRNSIAVTDFETMVKRGYPIIAKSKKAEFGLAFDTGDQAVVNVRVSAKDGTNAQYQYLLKLEGGKWHIMGVEEIKPDIISV